MLNRLSQLLPAKRAGRFFSLTVGLFLFPPAVGTKEKPAGLRYDLRPGDHLVYRQTFTQDIDSRVFYGLPAEKAQERKRQPGESREILLRAEWKNHVLVLDEQAGSFAIGVQRNRTGFELLQYKIDGHDRLHEQRPQFFTRVDRGAVFAEASRLRSNGTLLLPWSAIREWRSKILYQVHELLPLPNQPVAPGDRWKAATAPPFLFQAIGWEEVNDEECLHIDGTSEEQAFQLQLRYWFCPVPGVLGRVEFDGIYPGGGLQKIHEKIVLEFIERRRGEDLRKWLADPDLQDGASTALFASDSLLMDSSDLDAMFDNSSPAVQMRAAALIYRRRLPPPTRARLVALLRNESPMTRRLAIRLLEQGHRLSARPLIEEALADAKHSVREAALSWVRSRLPPQKAATVSSADDARAAWTLLSEVPSGHSGVAHGNDGSISECRDLLAAAGLLQQESQASWNYPGTYLLGMTTKEFYGWPYVVRVPEDYRGDEPFPLVIYLAGGGGASVGAAALAHNGVKDSPYLVIYPDASGFWWHERATTMVDALLIEVLRLFNVDTNRIFLSGLSNGGSGTFYYASLWPHRFAAAVPSMGAGIYPPEIEEDARPLPENLANLPLLFLHGEKDKTIPPWYARETVKRLRPRFVPVETYYFPDLGHSIGLGLNDEGRTIEFFQRHVREPYPRSLFFKARDLRYRRHYWIEILEKAKEIVTVEARIEGENTIRLQTEGVRRVRLLLRSEMFSDTGPVRIVLNGREVFSGPLPNDCETLRRSWTATADPVLAYSAALAFEVD